MGSTVYNFPVTFKHHSDTSANCPPRARFDTAALRTAKKVFRVPKYETVQDIADDESRDAELGFSGVDLTHVDTYSMSRKGKERETTPDPDVRSAKRRKVDHDFAFLETSLPHSIQPDISPSPSGFAVPSSDLLKCIHHFACNYYSDRGQLFNASRTYRKAKKQRRLAKLAAKERPSLEDDANSGEEEGPVPDAGTDPPQTTHIDRRRDMYKIMDGSALLAIGMLLQEHIARVLTPRIPDGWEQGVLDEYEDDGEDEETSGGHDHEEEGEDEDEDDDEEKDEDDDGDEDGDEDEDGDGDGDEDKDEDADGDGDGDGDLDEDEDPDEDGEDPGSDENNIDDPDEWGPRDDRSESDEEDSD